VWTHGLSESDFVCDLELGICDLFGIYDLEFEISAGLPAVVCDLFGI
jgi:hypothetical protein